MGSPNIETKIAGRVVVKGPRRHERFSNPSVNDVSCVSVHMCLVSLCGYSNKDTIITVGKTLEWTKVSIIENLWVCV